MGSRAHYATIQDGKADLRYSHWGAQHIDSDLLWGPDVVVPFVQSLAQDDPAHVLLDATWSEGAVVLDIDNKRLQVSGGEAIGRDPELRRLWLQLAQLAWEGWNVSWAYHGISHVVDAIGVSRSRVLGKLPETPFDETKLYACHTQGRARMLLSVRDEHFIEHYGFDAPVEYYLVAGEKLIDCLRRCRLYSTAELEKGTKLPEDAIFIDKIERKLVVTLAPVFGFYDPRIREMIQSHWPGWEVLMNYEGLRRHPEVAQLDFRIPETDIDHMLMILRTAVCSSPAPPPQVVQPGLDASQSDSSPLVSGIRHKAVSLSRNERAKRFDELAARLKTQAKNK